MIGKLIELSIRHRLVVAAISVAVGVASWLSIQSAHIDVIPDIGENQQIIFSQWAGRAPQDIEDQITYPLSVALQGVPGVKTVRGISAFGFSNIYVIFDEKIDFYWARSRILEKLASIGDLVPKGVNPQLGPDATGLGQVYWYTVENQKDSPQPASLAKLRGIQDYYVKYSLQDVEGVSEVASIGGFVKEYQIDVDPHRLFASDLHFNSLVSAIKNSNSDVGAEVIESGGREMIVRGLGFFKSVEDIENVVIGLQNKTPVRVKDVATVSLGPGFRRGALDKNGTEAVGGAVTMRFGENPREVIERVKSRIKEIEPGLPPGVQIRSFYDRSEIIEKTYSTVTTALSQEIVITVIVVLLFLLHLKSSLLVSLTLPFGVGVSFLLMRSLDIGSNIMSLSGIVIAIGSMVDMGIVMAENIYSKLAERGETSLKERAALVTESAKEVGLPIFAAAMTTIVTFLPVFGLSGAEGKLFGPLAWAKTLAMFGAVLVSVTLIPALSVWLLSGKLKPIESNTQSKWLVAVYEKVLNQVLSKRKTFLVLPGLVLALGLFSFSRLGSEFMPSLNEGELLYMPVTTPDVSITEARKLLAYTDKKLKEHPLVAQAVGKLGRAETAIDPAPVAMFETVIKLVPESEWPKGKSIYDIMGELDGYLQVPGLINSWLFPIENRIGMISTGIKTQIGIKIFGSDLDKLEKLSAEVAKVVEEVPGASGVYADRISGKPYIEFKVDRLASSRFGINVGTVNQVLQTAVGGMAIGEVYEGRERYPIRVRYKKEYRDRMDRLRSVLVPSPLGQHIPLGQLADIRVVTGPASIQSENGKLRSLVLLNVRGRDTIGFVNEAKAKVLDKVKLPPGYSVLWAGQYENQQRASQRLLVLIPLALLINFLIILWAIRSSTHSLIVFSAIPVAFSGGLILLWLGGFTTSVAVWVGFIALFGIAVDDGIVMVTYLREELRRIAPKTTAQLKQVIVNAGKRRIRPLVMTTTTTVIALMPVIWATSNGAEVMKPMAIPTLGGMVVASLSLFIVPVVFSFVEERNLKSEENKGELL